MLMGNERWRGVSCMGGPLALHWGHRPDRNGEWIGACMQREKRPGGDTEADTGGVGGDLEVSERSF